jgi:putative flavoprotein involved in K+ transport
LGICHALNQTESFFDFSAKPGESHFYNFEALINAIMATLDQIETVVVGAGQAGLITSYHLTQQQHEHIVLEQSDKAAFNWRNRCWDSLTLVTPNWAFYRIPGAKHNHAEREGFMPRDQVIRFFDNYITEYKLPVQYNTQVTAIEKDASGAYLIHTNQKAWKAKNVVIATGFLQHPKIPAAAKNFPSNIRQLHSSEYRNPDALPKGAVLVVGSAHSGCLITEELYLSGRKVFLSVGNAGRLPRRYRGKDIMEWFEMIGVFDLTPEQLPPGMGKFDAIPQISQTKGGHSMNLHQFARDGVTLLGHVLDVINNKTIIAPDLHRLLEKNDQFEREACNMIDGYIQANGLNAPPADLPQWQDGYKQPVIGELDLQKENINTTIWATGYRFDYSLLKLPVLDEDGFPIQTSGVSNYPGLYFAGLPWMPSEKSGFLVGVAESVRHIASVILEKERP